MPDDSRDLSSAGPGDPRGAEHRRHPRFQVTALVDCTGHELLLNHRLGNISLGGLCLRSESLEEVGTVVDLVISFPELESTLATQGEVVWCNREPPGDMGIRYLHMDDERRNALRRMLTSLMDRVGSRGGE